MSGLITWNLMSKQERLITINHCMSVASEEKRFNDDLAVFLRKEIKRLDGLVRYNGALPLLFKDHYGIAVEFGVNGSERYVLSMKNASGQGELSCVALLLCQAKFCFDEKSMTDVQFFHVVNAIESVGEKPLFCGMAIYSRPYRRPKALDGWV